MVEEPRGGSDVRSTIQAGGRRGPHRKGGRRPQRKGLCRPERAERPRRDDRRSRGRDDDGPTPMGLGDHVPSFMLRSVKLPPKTVDVDEPETAEQR